MNDDMPIKVRAEDVCFGDRLALTGMIVRSNQRAGNYLVKLIAVRPGKCPFTGTPVHSLTFYAHDEVFIYPAGWAR